MSTAHTERRPLPGTWLATCTAADGAGALSLLRAEPAAAVACAETPATRVLFDGTLYNRHDLCTELEAPPEGNDAALVAAAYERWGEDFLARIKGIFALILWDRHRATFLAARDRMGVYPLYYCDTGRELVFSTQVDELLRHPAVSPAVNRAALADHLLYRWPDVEETFYEKVRRLPPGHLLRVDQLGQRVSRYWDPAPPGMPVNWIREEELERFDALFAQAVRRCLTFGPPAVYLSGGLDSVSVAAVAAEESRRMGLGDLLALSLVFPDPECDEEAVQRGVAAALRLPQEILPFEEAVGPAGLLRAALDMSGNSPLPLLNAWFPAYLRLGLEARRRGCGVILTGTGGDEWLGVTPLLAADLLRALDVVALCRLWAAQRRSYQLSFFPHLHNLLWVFGARPLLREAVLRAPGGRSLQKAVRALRRRTHPPLPAWVAPDPELHRQVDRRAHAANEPVNSGSHYLREMRMALDHTLVSWEMEESFHHGRRIGLLILHPFLDVDLVDFLYRTPPRLLNKGGWSKGLVRQSVALRFPHLGFDRQKKLAATGFFHSILLKEGREVHRLMGGIPALVELGIVDWKMLETRIESALANRQMMDDAARFWYILSLEAWLRPRI